MSNLEHYFENLLFSGKDVNGDLNKNSLTKEEQNAVEICANYVLFTLFCGREELKEALGLCEDFDKVDDTYSTGHNENETVVFEKLKMVEPLDRAVVFLKGADETVEVTE